jgi:TRAP-type mannitol/chloroaromatic compound transport system permease small subunit
MSLDLSRIERFFARLSDAFGALSAVILLLLVANVFYDVVMRYLFNDVSIAMQELEWHLFSALILFGIAYALKADAHVRVDIVYERLGPRPRALIDIVGTLLFVWPFCLLIGWYGIGFAHEAWQLGEQSGDPGGLPHRWIVKSLISVAFAMVMLSSVAFLLRAVSRWRGDPDIPSDDIAGARP